MEQLLWNAARRLAMIVAGTLCAAAIPFVHDARIRAVPAAAGAIALALLAASVPPMLRARKLLRQAQAPGPLPAAAEVYRADARAPDPEPTANRATHAAAIAFLLLSLAGTFVVVAAASR